MSQRNCPFCGKIDLHGHPKSEVEAAMAKVTTVEMTTPFAYAELMLAMRADPKETP